MSRNNPFIIAFITLIVIYLFNIGGIQDTINDIFVIPHIAPAQQLCLYDGAVMTIGAINKYEEADVYVDGVYLGKKEGGSTLDVSVGSNVEIYYGGEIDFDTGKIIEGSSYAIAKTVVPCKELVYIDPQRIIEAESMEELQSKLGLENTETNYDLIDTGDLEQTSTGELDLGDLLST